MKHLAYSLLLSMPFLVLACGTESPSDDSSSHSTAGLPDSYWLTSDPADAEDVSSARTDLVDGASVTVRGVIGGTKRPFVEGLAAFNLVDPALEPCSEDEGCRTPWDYCCVDSQTIADNSVTVEFRDGDVVRSTSLQGVHGLENLAKVAVQGTAERDAQGNVTIVASGVRVLN